MAGLYEVQMKTHTALQWIKQRFFDDDQTPGVDPYFAQVDWFEISPDILYATGFIARSDHRVSQAEYAKGFAEVGAKEMMYFRPDDKAIFGGDQVYVQRNGEFEPVTGLYLKQL